MGEEEGDHTASEGEALQYAPQFLRCRNPLSRQARPADRRKDGEFVETDPIVLEERLQPLEGLRDVAIQPAETLLVRRISDQLVTEAIWICTSY